MTATIATKLSNHYDIEGIANWHANALDHRVNEADHLVPNTDGSMDATGHSDLVCLDCTIVIETVPGKPQYDSPLEHGKYRIVEDAQNDVFRLQTADIEGNWTIGLDYGGAGGLEVRTDFYRLISNKRNEYTK